MQTSTQQKGQRTSTISVQIALIPHVHCNGLGDPQGSADHTLRTTALAHATNSCRKQIKQPFTLWGGTDITVWHLYVAQCGPISSAAPIHSPPASQPLQTPRFRVNPWLLLLMGLVCLECTPGVLLGSLAFFKTLCRCAAPFTPSGFLNTDNLK